MIRVKNVYKSFGSTEVLKDISFSVKKGEILGFLGPNGAGKTTTLKIITSFWTQDSGVVKINSINTIEDSLATRKKIGYLPETVPLYDEMTVFEYLKFVANIRGIKKDEVIKKIRDVAKSCGLRDVIKRPIDELSKGYKQRVGIAQAIIHNPEVLILDEPTTGLDPNQIAEIRDLIKKIGKEKTVIFSTHILSEVSATCDRVIIINNGKIVGEGTPDELLKKAGDEEVIYVKIKGDKDEILKKIKEINEVDSITVENVPTQGRDASKENVYTYVIIPKENADIMEKVSRSISSRGWVILGMDKKKITLEDVFKKLTK